MLTMKYKELHILEQIKSDSLREITKHLIDNGNIVTFYGQAWSNTTANWIYFDLKLDLKRLKQKFTINDNIIIHENLDPKSGTERGFIDNKTGEGLMGKIR